MIDPTPLIDTGHLVAYGVLAQLALSLAHHFVRSPQRQTQLDAIERKVQVVLNQLGVNANTDPNANTLNGAASDMAGKDGN